MAQLSSIEKLRLEKFLEMSNGYVLNFTNRKFQDFIIDSISVDIYDEKYSDEGNSKANRLRTLWKKETDQTVSKLISDFLEYWKTQQALSLNEISPNEQSLYNECIKITERLKQSNSVSGKNNTHATPSNADSLKNNNLAPKTLNKTDTNNTQIRVAIIGAIAIVIAACIGFMGNIVNVFAPPAIEVASTKILITPTIPSCSPNLLDPITVTPIPPSLVVIVIDTTNESSYIFMLKEVVSNALPNALNSGDKIVIIQTAIGNQSSEIIYEDVFRASNQPSIYIPPTQYPTLLPTITPVRMPETNLEIIAATTTAQAQLVAIQATAQRLEFEHECAFSQYNNQQTQIAQYTTTLKDTQIEFTKNLVQSIRPSNPPSNSGQLLESLLIADQFFDRECSKYSKCKMVIFSDLTPIYQSPSNSYSYSNFWKVDIMSVLSNCKGGFDASCQSKINFWQDTFIKNGNSDSIFIYSDEAESSLLSFLSR